ncbi:hypothetical protein RCL1_001444 [Eukaryota sp. TZLM3-RCL]
MVVFPHVFVVNIVLRVAIFFTVPPGALWTFAITQPLLSAFFFVTIRKIINLNMRNPSLRDVLLFYTLFTLFAVTTFWYSMLVRSIYGILPPDIWLAFAEWTTAAVFSFALIGPYFLAIVVPLVDHLLLFKYSLLRSLSETHSCFICHPPSNLYILDVLFLLSIVTMVLLFWLSTFGIAWYVGVLFLSFLFIHYGFYWTVFFGLAFFVAVVFANTVFDVIAADAISITLFIALSTMLVLFSARLADYYQEEMSRSVAQLEDTVEQRTRSLKQSELDLEGLLQSRRALISQVSHDLVTPVHQAIVSLATLSTLSFTSQQLHSLAQARLSQFLLARQVDDIIVDSSLDTSEEPLLMKTTLQHLIEEVSADYTEWGLNVVYLEKEKSNHPASHLVVIPFFRYSKIFDILLRTFLRSAHENPKEVGQIEATIVINLLSNIDPDNVHFELLLSSDGDALNLDLATFCDNMLLERLVNATGSSIYCYNDQIQWRGNAPLVSVMSFSTEQDVIAKRFDTFSVHSKNKAVELFIQETLRTILNEAPLQEFCESKKHLVIVDSVFPTVIDECIERIDTRQIVRITHTKRSNSLDHPVTAEKLLRCIKLMTQDPLFLPRLDYPQVLVVDDSKMNVTLLQGMLKKLDVLSDAAFDGEQAIEVFGERLRDDSKDSYKLVIMDILMPKLDGIEATKAIRNLERATTKSASETAFVAALSAHALQDETSLKKMSLGGFDIMLKKPLSLARLESILLSAGISH